MRTPKQNFGFSQKILVLAMMAALDASYAGDDEIAKLINPDTSSVSIGIGLSTGDKEDRAIFGQYNGLREDSAGLLINYETVRRDSSGLWTNAELVNFGLDGREISISQQQQGDWKYAAHFGQTVRHDPRTIKAITGASYDLELKRRAFSLSAEKWISPSMSLEASFKSENKDGYRMFGVGNYCSGTIAGAGCVTTPTTGAFLLSPERIESFTRQFEAKLNYLGEGYLLSGGYYGSYYKNAQETLTPGMSSAVNSTLGAYLSQPVALSPDNEAHQFYVSGNYALAPKTKATFSASYTQAKQTDGFGALAISGAPSNLSGELNRTFAQLGVTSRLTPQLSLAGDWRREAVKDDTPTHYFGNTPSSLDKDNGKLELSILLPQHYRVIAGIDYSYVKRARPVETTNIPSTSLSGLREETEEYGGRIEVKRSLSDNVNASVSLVHSEREGYHWIGLVGNGAERYPFVRNDALDPSGVLPYTMMDRKRDKVRLVADWAATEQLTLQFIAEDGKDKYAAPTSAGLNKTGMRNFALDASLNLSDQWKMTGYANYGEQVLWVDHRFGYSAELNNVNTSFGLGAIGKLDSKTEVGGNLVLMSDNNRYKMLNSLPEVSYEATGLKLYGKYGLDADSDVVVDLQHQRTKFAEWTWGYNGVPFVYSDGATVTQLPNQNVTFIGARYVYKLK